MLPLPDTAPYLVSPYAGIHPPRSPRRKKTIGQIRRETACSPNRSKIERERGGRRGKRRKEKEETRHFYPSDFSLFPRCEDNGRRKRRSRSKGRKSEKKTYGRCTCTCTERSQRKRERERVLLRSLHREMVNGDNEARDKSGEGAS